jgi:hypothetical protein
MKKARAASAIERDLEVLAKFIRVYCRENHGTGERGLCEECSSLWDYARMRLEKCPYDPKPKCKDCTTHCYRPEPRKKIQEIMRFSGIHFVKRGRVDWLWKYFT